MHDFEYIKLAVTEYNLLNHTVMNYTNVLNISGESWWTNGVQVQILVVRYSAYYSLTFVGTGFLITTVALFGVSTVYPTGFYSHQARSRQARTRRSVRRSVRSA